MIVICEPECWDLVHVPFNAALLEIIRTAFPTERVTFYGEKAHLKYVKLQVQDEISSSIDWKAISIPPRRSKVYQRFFPDLKIIGRLLKSIDDSPRSHLVLTCVSPSTLIALKILIRRSIFRNRKVQVILHAGLSALNGWRSRNPLLRVQDIRTALSIKGTRGIRYIVLENSIRGALYRKLPFLRGRVDVLDHPIPPNEEAEKILGLRPPFRFGFIGSITPIKGFNVFLRLASELSMKFPNYLEFHAIGQLQKNMEKVDMKGLKSGPSLEPLSRHQYVHHLKKLHYVCFPYQKEHYELCASGALLDAIAWEKPFIASRIPIFENLFYKFGDIGYLCANEDEFRKTMEHIIESADVNRYKNQVLSIRQIKYLRAPKSLASKYRELCKY